MSILKEDGEFILICDNCEESYEERFEQFDDAVFAKKPMGGKVRKITRGGKIFVHVVRRPILIDKLLQRAYKNSKQKGFWRDYENTLAILKGPDSCSICERFDTQNPCIICGPTTHYKNI